RFTDAERERIAREARATLERLRDVGVRQESHEDPLERWLRLKPQPEEPKQERDLDTTALVDQRIGAFLEAERQKHTEAETNIGEAPTGIADEPPGLDERLKKIEERRRSNKTARKPRPIALPSFLGPTHSERDPSVRYTQPRVQ